jgi:hypothetical protein
VWDRNLAMKKRLLGIAADSERQLRKAIEAEVRKKHQQELKATNDHWQRAAIEDKIEQEIKGRMKLVASPQSLWSSH